MRASEYIARSTTIIDAPLSPDALDHGAEPAPGRLAEKRCQP